MAAIIADVRAEGDAALLRYTERFDRLTLTADRLRIAADEIDAAVAGIPSDLMAALDLAATRIEAFHRLQVPADLQTNGLQPASPSACAGRRWMRSASMCRAARPRIRRRC